MNLTNGLACTVENPRYLRIQSTWCEQKLWADVLWTLGADFYYHLARGEQIIVHDQSERRRETRACWQGLAWVRYCCERAWGLPVSPPIMRGGHSAEGYFQTQYEALPERIHTYLAYYKQQATGPLLLSPCSCKAALR